MDTSRVVANTSEVLTNAQRAIGLVGVDLYQAMLMAHIRSMNVWPNPLLPHEVGHGDWWREDSSPWAVMREGKGIEYSITTHGGDTRYRDNHARLNAWLDSLYEPDTFTVMRRMTNGHGYSTHDTHRFTTAHVVLVMHDTPPLDEDDMKDRQHATRYWSMGTDQFVMWSLVKSTGDMSLAKHQCPCAAMGFRLTSWTRYWDSDLHEWRRSDLRLCRFDQKCSDLRLCTQKRSDLRFSEGGGYAAAPPRCQLPIFTYAPDGPGSLTRDFAAAYPITAGHSLDEALRLMVIMGYGSSYVLPDPLPRRDVVAGHSDDGTPRWSKFTGRKGGRA